MSENARQEGGGSRSHRSAGLDAISSCPRGPPDLHPPRGARLCWVLAAHHANTLLVVKFLMKMCSLKLISRSSLFITTLPSPVSLPHGRSLSCLKTSSRGLGLNFCSPPEAWRDQLAPADPPGDASCLALSSASPRDIVCAEAGGDSSPFNLFACCCCCS